MFQKNLNISKTKQDIEKLKTPLRLVWKCCSEHLKLHKRFFVAGAPMITAAAGIVI